MKVNMSMFNNNEKDHLIMKRDVRKVKKSEVFLLVFFILLSVVYLTLAWDRNEKRANDEAIMLAKSLTALLHTEHVAELTGTLDDLDMPDYQMTKTGLVQLTDTHDQVVFAYVLAQKNGDIIFLVDSENPDSSDYSQPGQIYTEADEVTRSTFESNEVILTKPAEDRWGKWITAFVPIVNPADGSIMAVLGLDYDATLWINQLWRNMIPDFIIIGGVFILVIVLLQSWRQHDKMKELSQKLEYDEAFYRSVIEQAPTGIVIVDDKNFLFESEYVTMTINPKFEEIVGRSRTELAKLTWLEITHPDDIEEDLRLFEKFKSNEIDGYAMEKRFIRPDGSSIWTHMQVTRLAGILSDKTLHLALVADISERKNAQLLLLESERSKSVLLSHLPGMAYRSDYDREWSMQYVSSGCYQLTGYLPEEIINNKVISYNDLIAPEYQELLWNEWKRILALRLPFRYEYAINTADGKTKWVLELGEGVYNDSGDLEALEGIVFDITNRKKLEDTLKYNNDHNRWTGLFNQYYLESILSEDLNKNDLRNKALVGINLNSLQTITTTYGFHYAQDLIRKTAEVLRQYSSDNYILFSTYWDRFVFYVKDYQDQTELETFCSSLAKVLSTLLKSERITGGIGVLEIDESEELNADMLLKKVLIASEKALEDQDLEFEVCFYDVNMEAQIIKEETILTQLSKISTGIEYDGLYLQYQPIVDLKTDKISAFEALARLKNDKFGFIPPVEFIHLTEKTRLIIPIGEKIIDQALTFYLRLKAKGHGDIGVSINVSVIQLLSTGFIKIFLDKINKAKILPGHITIEITESVFSSNFDEINRIIGEFRKNGIKIAIDDFGTGYSSLEKEKELNVDCLKIDRHFIENLTVLDPRTSITSDIISIAHKMGHTALAEGVETLKQKEYLISCGCDKIQGFLISRPVDEDVALQLLKQQDNLTDKKE